MDFLNPHFYLSNFCISSSDTSRVIATMVSCRMTSLINPVLKAKQTKEGSFLLSPDESVCIRQLK